MATLERGLRIKEVVMFVFEGRANMNIAIITITELMATNKRFCPGLKRKEIVFASREKMRNLQGKETRWERISGGASENLNKHISSCWCKDCLLSQLS